MRDRASSAVTFLAVTGLLVVLSLAAISRYLVNESERDARFASELGSNIQESLYYDEVLTMSALYAAASGDLGYIDRYEEAAQEYDALLAGTAELLAEGDSQTDLESIVATSQPLLLAEARAFELIRAGRRADAIGLLTGPQYRRDKARFDAAFENTLDSLRSERDRSLDHSRDLQAAALAAGALGAALITGAGVFARRSTRRWYLDREAARAEQAAADRRTALILDSAGEGIYGLDAEGYVTFANPAALALTGHTADELIGQRSHDVVHHSRTDGTPLPLEECQVHRAQRDRRTATGALDLYWRADGSSFPVELTVTPTRDGDDGGAVVVFRDITERRAVDRMKDEFISVVSHELRTPLTSIRGSLGLLTSGALGPLTPQAARMLEIAESNTDRLVRLINDILDIERIESGEIRLELTRVSAQSLVAEAVDGVAGMADGAGAELVAGGEDAILRVDRDRILQALTNLLSNAVKFSPQGGRVEVSVRREGADAVFSVRDEGRGIPADKLESIFERFRQVDASDARQKGGSGLGLAISRSIVEQHGGRIWVESEVGRGSSFSFSVPAIEPAPDAEPRDGAGRRVLIVDDDPAVLVAVSGMLSRHGYAATTASTGAEALRSAERNPPHAVLLDLIMPRSSGWDVLATLRSAPATAHVPVVILSVLREGQGGSPGGYQAWLSKPVEERELLAALERAIARSKQPVGLADARRILLIEDDADLAAVLVAMLERNGLVVEHAVDAAAARAALGPLPPELVIADVGLGEGMDGTVLLEELHGEGLLSGVPVVVYTALELDDRQRRRLAAIPALALTKGRVPPEAFEQRILQLLGMDGDQMRQGPPPASAR